MKVISVSLILLLLAGCQAGRSAKPDILLIIIDTLRADHVHCYGYGREITPTLDSLAAEGTMWSNVQAQAAWTLPAMSTIFTGLTERQHLAGIRAEQQYALDQSLQTLPEIFSENGYQTAGFYTVPVMGEGYGFDQGMDHCDMEGCQVIFPADVMVDKYLMWADSLFDPETPCFTILHFFDPHFQYDPPVPYSTMFSSMSHPGTRWALCPASSMIDAWGRGLIGREELGRMMDLYDGEIAYLNRQISRLFDGMRRREMLDNTLIMVIADHGEEFDDHGGVTHGVQLHSEITGVPLIISGPEVPAGRVENVLAGQIDVLPTLLEYADIPVPEGLPGTDLLSFSVPEDRVLPASGYYADVSHMITVRTGSVKLFWDTVSDSSFMFDLSNDPHELQPLPPDSGLLEEAAFYWATPPRVDPQPMEDMEGRVEMFRNLGYLR